MHRASALKKKQKRHIPTLPFMVDYAHPKSEAQPRVIVRATKRTCTKSPKKEHKKYLETPPPQAHPVETLCCAEALDLPQEPRTPQDLSDNPNAHVYPNPTHLTSPHPKRTHIKVTEMVS